MQLLVFIYFYKEILTCKGPFLFILFQKPFMHFRSYTNELPLILEDFSGIDFGILY